MMGAAGPSANLVQGLDGSVDIMYGFAKGKKEIYRCDTLDTIEFEPTPQYIKDSITTSPPVQSMITGLKIATGLTTSVSKTTLHGPILRVGVDATVLGVPASAGPEVEFATTTTRTVSQGTSADKIVFAYRVVRIQLKSNGQVRSKHVTGGKYSLDESDNVSGDEDEKWDIEHLGKDDVGADLPGYSEIEVV